jgi:hypothetical protein
MSSPVPQKQSFPVFPYTKGNTSIIDVVPTDASYTKIYRAGMLVSSVLPPGVHKTSYFDNHATGGQGAIRDKTVDFTSPSYTGLADLNYAGIITHDFPENRPKLGDEYGDLALEDRDLAPHINTIAGSMVRVAMALPGSPDLILVRLWDGTGNQAEAIAAADIGKDVYVSRTVSSFTGKAGYGTIDDLSGDAGSVKIGTLLESPLVGSEWGYMRPDQLVEV